MNNNIAKQSINQSNLASYEPLSQQHGTSQTARLQTPVETPGQQVIAAQQSQPSQRSQSLTGQSGHTQQANARSSYGTTSRPTLQASMDALSNANTDVNKAKQALDNAKSPDDKRAAMLKLQEAMNLRSQIFNMLTKMLKNDHDNIMAVIRNLP